MNSLTPRLRRLAPTLCGAVLLSLSIPAGPVAAGTISVNFVGLDDAGAGGRVDYPNTLNPEEEAGFIPAANWNNATGATGTIANAVDNTGAATTATVNWTGQAVWSWERSSDVVPDNPTGTMFNGYLDTTGNDGSHTISVTNVPYGLYDVYVYIDGEHNGSPRPMRVNLNPGGDGDNPDLDRWNDEGANWDGEFIFAEATATPGTVNANVALFESITGSQFDIFAEAENFRAAINGFQIVEVDDGDDDGDGIPNAVETANGLDPGNPDDAAGDLDDDGSTNLEEYQRGTGMTNPDSDGDNLPDGVETGDGIFVDAGATGTDPLNPDSDGDGLTDDREDGSGVYVNVASPGTNPNLPDTDGDTLLDGWETFHVLIPLDDGSINPDNGAEGDPDGDTLTNAEEQALGTHPVRADTDGDGLSDGVETGTGVFVDGGDTGTDPLDPDTDGDGVLDGVESNTGRFRGAADTGTDPHAVDTDLDGFSDGEEVFAATNPLDPDNRPAFPIPVGYWPFDDGANPTADRSPGGRDGDVNGDAIFVAGRSGAAGDSAIEFDGTDDFVGTELSLNGFAEFTIAGWVKSTAIQPNRTGLMGQNDAFEFGIINPTTIELWNPGQGAVQTPTPETFDWTHIAVVGSAATRVIYVDGVAAATGGGTTDNNSDFLFNIGGGGIADATGNFFTGCIDDVAVWDAALDAGQVAALFAGEASPIGRPVGAVTATPILSYPAGGIDALVLSSAPADTPVADLEALDDRGEPRDAAFALAPGEGDTDNNLYDVLGDQLVVAGDLSGLDGVAHSVRIQAGDAAVVLALTVGLDGDGDGLLDAWENTFPGGVDGIAPDGDDDGDGVLNIDEFFHGSSPVNADSDGDTIPDGDELSGANGFITDPARADTDGDGLDDNVEDGGGVFVSAEQTGSDPTDPDTDGDGLSDGDEVSPANGFVTDPNKDDTDGDGFRDKVEIDFGGDPTNPAIVPETFDDDLVDSNAAGESWLTAADWASGEAPIAAGNYRVGDGLVLRSPAGPDPVFGGLSLTIGAGGTLRLAHAGTAQVGDLRLDGGTVVRDDGVTSGLAGRLEVVADSALQNGGLLELGSDLSGSATLTVDGGGTYELSGDNDGFNGTLRVNIGTTLAGLTPGSLDSADLHVNDGVLDVQYGLDSERAIIVEGANTRVQFAANSRINAIQAVVDGGPPIDLIPGLIGEDGLYTAAEINTGIGTDVFFFDGTLSIGGDADGDGLPDDWEILHFGGIEPEDSAGDPDGDGLANTDEFAAGSDPNDTDSDDDTLDDFEEVVNRGTNPLSADTDGDGLADPVESGTGVFVDAGDTGSNPLVADTDGDTLPDGVETGTGIVVDANDTGTDPNLADTDGDLFSDPEEIGLGTDPSDPDDFPPFPAPVGYWSFDDGQAVTADLSGGGNPGTLNGGASFVAGHSGRPGDLAVSFNGTDAYVGTDVSLLNDREAFTLAGWVQSTVSQPNRTGLFGQNDAVEFAMNNAGSIEIWTPSGGAVQVPVTPTFPWMHIAVTATADARRIYFDGELVMEGAGTGPSNTEFLFNIGGGGIADAMGNFFTGAMDDIAVYDAALLPTYIRALANGDLTPLGEPVVTGPADSDGDGLSDEDELALGLDPNDPTSTFAVGATERVHGAQGELTQLSFTVPGGPGVSFDIAFTADILDPDWEIIDTVAGGGVFTDESAARLGAREGFYRVSPSVPAAAP